MQKSVCACKRKNKCLEQFCLIVLQTVKNSFVLFVEEAETFVSILSISKWSKTADRDNDKNNGFQFYVEK